MSELRAGGLALVVRCTDQNLIGKVVTLIELLKPGSFKYDGEQYFFKGDSAAWLCEIEDGIAVFRPSSLMPIDGDDFSHEDERKKELNHG